MELDSGCADPLASCKPYSYQSPGCWETLLEALAWVTSPGGHVPPGLTLPPEEWTIWLGAMQRSPALRTQSALRL